MYNPALLNADMDKEMHLGIKPYFSGIGQYDLMGVNHWDQKKVTWGLGVHFLDYGNIPMTDFSGNEIGTMHPSDYAIQLSAASDYIQHFRIGSTFKFIHSNYGIYKSSGFALDIGLLYISPNELNQISILVKNIGTQITTGLNRQELPFNVLLGYSKKLAHAPIQFSITADRLSVWNNVYYDPNYSNAIGASAPGQMQNLFNHLILASEFYIGKQVNLDVGYNFIRRYDLNVQNQSNGLNGFAAGMGVKLERMKFQYGSSFFQSNAYHHFSIIYKLKK
jgi:hypothetical protein